MAWQKNFQKDLQEANQLENRLKDEFEKNINCTVTTSQDKGSFSDWDLKVEYSGEDIVRTIEVKQDKWVSVTGNLAVEFQRTMSDGTVRPTCISVSKADLYAYYFNNTFYIIDTEELRRMIEAKKYWMITKGGDGGRASCYLFKKDVFLESAVELKDFLQNDR